MRLLHTSDWHLGQNFYSKSRAAEHDAFLTWLLDRAQEHEVDAIIVAGDIFDTGSPPSYARELYNRFVVQLQQTGCRLVVLAGNHDSVAMLNESRDILAFLHTTVVANAGYAPIELPLRDGTPGAIFCPVPFLRPRELVTSQAGHSGREKQQLLLHAISDYYQEQYQQACALRGDRPLPIIASGHLTTVGASKSDAVRDIYIGTLDAFPAQHFPPADYIALGHIHRAQMVGGCEHIRYSGSPLPLSFDETGKAKSVHLVSFSEGRLSAVETLEVPVTQPLAVIKGDLAAITAQLEQTATLTGLDYGRFTRSMLLSQGQFAAFLNAKPSDRAELLEELTGTEIYGQISAMVYEQHKAARHALEKFEAQAAGIVLLTEAQQQALQESLQVLTDEEKALLAQQQSQQQQLQWLTRRDELAQQQQQAATRQQQARQALADAAPALAKLELAQPAAQLRPLWERQQEQTAGLAQTRQRISEVNARLLASTVLRARIRQGALRAQQQRQAELADLAQWLAAHERFRLWGQEIAGWRAQFSQLTRDKQQLTAQSTRLAALRQKLATLPASPLALSADDVAAAIEQQTQSRPLRQRLISLHEQHQLLRKRLRQNADSVQQAQAEQVKLNATLTLRREQYKDKNQHYLDLKALCQREETIKDLESYRDRLEAGKPCPLCGACEHPAIEQYASLTLTDNQRRRDALEKEVAALKEEGLLILGQVKALTQQLQRDTEAAGRLAEEEQALTKAWQETCASLHIARDIAQEINDWMQEQERYEQQLYQLSQRLMLQSQLNDQQALERQAEQQLAATRQGLESALQALALSLPAEGTEAAWLHARESEFAQWQAQQTRHDAIQQQIAALRPLLETLPTSDETEVEAESAIPDNWREIHEECLSLHSQLVAQQQQETQEKARLDQSQAQFTSALAASRFSDREAFLAALLDDETAQRLTQLKQTLEQQLQQAAALCEQATRQHEAHLALRPQGVDADVPTLQTQLHALAQRLRDNTTRQGEIRQQLRQDAESRQQQQALGQQIAEAAQLADDWGYLNSLIGSSTGDRFRKFAQGLTLDNLVWLANQQLNRLHGRYLLQRKASEALELEVVDTWQADAVRDTRTLSGGESFLVSLALALALSDLVSHKTRIDSLFLDEGFGTLDSETLDTALDALDALNASGKIIGVISHVEAMKDRIPVQIKVKKINGLGYSRLDKAFAVE
ncbi:exonuclease subunit SbcC [Klebsiella pneumoniae subsp. pneumoniae]|nr:exonuclease subunit SbcC [Klebsiella pneumoniae]WIM74901.1 exonuclease subunit SbcC [Klebsiella pneumoniae subsp. pneumoniae]